MLRQRGIIDRAYGDVALIPPRFAVWSFKRMNSAAAGTAVVGIRIRYECCLIQTSCIRNSNMLVITVRIEYDSQVGASSISTFRNQPAVARPRCINSTIRENYWWRYTGATISCRLRIFVLKNIFPIGVRWILITLKNDRTTGRPQSTWGWQVIWSYIRVIIECNLAKAVRS